MIDVGFCPACGQMKQIGIIMAGGGTQLVTVYCACGQVAPETTQIMPGETYCMNVETKTEEAESHGDSDSGDVQTS